MDGTWQNPYQLKKREDKTKVLKPSNVLKLARAVPTRSPTDGLDQLIYYDGGIGASVKYPGAANKMARFFDSKLGGAWGAGFEANIEEGFRFLVHNHRRGDAVFLFGFSRGAATVRALTRFLDWLGGVPTKNDAYFAPLFFKHYIETHGEGDPAEVTTASGRRPDEPLVPVAVKLLAVWDTVMALGSRFAARDRTSSESLSFHVGAAPARCVHHARQALAIDERRYDFRPEVWLRAGPEQSLKQRWFVGSHANVGGGYVHDGLANIPLHWLLREAEELGLYIDATFTGHYIGFPLDKHYDSMNMMYKTLDFIRLRRGKGKRRLTGYPESANLAIDTSVFQRIRLSTEEPKGMKKYRPEPVARFLASQPDTAAYLQQAGLSGEDARLPDDFLREIERFRD